MQLTRNDRRMMEKENNQWPLTLRQIPRENWPQRKPEHSPIEVWRSRGFLVQVYAEDNGYVRMSVCRTRHGGESWDDLITWEELMVLKRECGRGDKDALEVYPADRDVVNVANMRHLFFPPTPVSFKWSNSNG